MLDVPAETLQRVVSGELCSSLTKISRSEYELVAYGSFRADPPFVWRVLDEVENYVHTMPRVKSVELLSRHEHGLRMRLTLDTPFPLPDISSLYDSVHTVADDCWRRQWKQIDKGLAPNHGTWTLIRRPDGKAGTIAEYRLIVEPLIPIPKKIIAMANNRVLPDLFAGIEKHSLAFQSGGSAAT